MGQAESARRDAMAAGEFVTVSEGGEQSSSRTADQEKEKELLLQHLNAMRQGESSSWQNYLTESMASVVDNGVGSINAGGLASILDSYKDWATRRLVVVDNAQRACHFQIMNVESQLGRARKAYLTCHHNTKLAADQMLQVTLLAKEAENLRLNVESALSDYNKLLADLDERLLVLESNSTGLTPHGTHTRGRYRRTSFRTDSVSVESPGRIDYSPPRERRTPPRLNTPPRALFPGEYTYTTNNSRNF